MSGDYGLSPMAEALMRARGGFEDDPSDYWPSSETITTESKLQNIELILKRIDEQISYANGPLTRERDDLIAERKELM